jgi:tyrosyl-tRNA synthetase
VNFSEKERMEKMKAKVGKQQVNMLKNKEFEVKSGEKKSNDEDLQLKTSEHGKKENLLEAEVDRQMEIIRQGALEIIGEEDLRRKIKRSLKTGKPMQVKLGLDPSAPDIHLGHGVVLRKIRQMQNLGHHAVLIIGDFTGKIGDPTGKSKGRVALTDREVLENAKTYQEQIFRILDPEKTQVRFNGEWLELLTLGEVVELAATVTVARMLERDDFQRRYEQHIPIGLHEFFYPLMQAYDSVAIEADVELGGRDQTFNILMGRSLQKERGMEPQAAIFMPLLEGLDGKEKMSKSLGNTIGVQEEAKVMFKKVMEVPDELILRYFELATDILPEDLRRIKEELEEGRNPRDVKLVLARMITGLYHDPQKYEEAEVFYEEAFGRKGIPEQVDELVIRRKTDEISLQELIIPLVEQRLIKSGNEFRRMCAQGGIQINGVKVSELNQTCQDGDVIKIGKKKFLRVKISS